MSLHNIAKQNYERGCNDLRNYGVHVQHFHQQFQQPVIDEKRGYKNNKVAEQLNPASYCWIVKYYKLHQQEPNREIDTKSNEEGSYVRFKCIESQIKDFLMQNIFVGNRINKQS